MLTDKERQEIIDMNSDDPILQGYIKKVMDNAPNLDNSVHIEGIATEWNQAEQIEGWKHISFAEAVERYKFQYEQEKKTAERHGAKMPPLEMDLSKPEEQYTINEELTAVSIEAQKKLGNVLEFGKKFMETGSLFDMDDEFERFYGTVLNEDTVKKAWRANELLDILELGCLSASIEKFEEPNPHFHSAILAVNFSELNGLDGTVLGAFQELTALADTITIVPNEPKICRIVFEFQNLWTEHRLITDQEAAEYWDDFSEEDFDEIDE